MTALMAWPRFHSARAEPQGAKQMAAPAEPRTPNMHRAKPIAPRECGWKHGDSGHSAGEKTMFNEATTRIDLTPTGLLMEGHRRKISTSFDSLHIWSVWNWVGAITPRSSLRTPRTRAEANARSHAWAAPQPIPALGARGRGCRNFPCSIAIPARCLTLRLAAFDCGHENLRTHGFDIAAYCVPVQAQSQRATLGARMAEGTQS